MSLLHDHYPAPIELSAIIIMVSDDHAVTVAWHTDETSHIESIILRDVSEVVTILMHHHDGIGIVKIVGFCDEPPVELSNILRHPLAEVCASDIVHPVIIAFRHIDLYPALATRRLAPARGLVIGDDKPCKPNGCNCN